MKTELELRAPARLPQVVEAGAHARAARSLGISQSTISETLSALERTLGTPVFQKAAQGSVLTPTGEALLPYARQMLALVERARDRARESVDAMSARRSSSLPSSR